jgi:hypothetical protein
MIESAYDKARQLWQHHVPAPAKDLTKNFEARLKHFGEVSEPHSVKQGEEMEH